MNASSAPARGGWDKVEFYTSFSLLLVLASVIATRLGFDDVWQLPTPDLVLSIIALVLILGSFWFARHRRSWRLCIVAFAAGTQLVPMVVRHPVILLPLIGALIPVTILLGCLFALSRKGTATRPPQGS